MTKEYCLERISSLNSDYKEFIEKELPKRLNSRDGRINLSQWFQAQQIIKNSGHYERRIHFLECARKEGFDVKINMQTYELSFHGIIERTEYYV